MEEVLDFLQRNIKLISIQDVIDMGIMAYVIYRGMKLLKDTSAMRLAKGILIIFAAQIIAESVGLNTVSFSLRLYFNRNCDACLNSSEKGKGSCVSS